MENAEMIVSIVIVVASLILFFLYLVYYKKKEPKEALEEIIDYMAEHKEELLSLKEKDLFKMTPEEIEELCRKLGLPIDGSKAELIAKILGHIKEKISG